MFVGVIYFYAMFKCIEAIWVIWNSITWGNMDFFIGILLISIIVLMMAIGSIMHLGRSNNSKEEEHKNV